MEEQIVAVRERIDRAARRTGRSSDQVVLLAVTKTHPRELVESALGAGLTVLGENRVQEAQEKYRGLHTPHELHLIGHLQRNKAKFVPGLFHWVESIDSLKTARSLSEKCEEAGWQCQVLLQYNCSGEQSKSGYESGDALMREAKEIALLPALHLRGVMTIGPFVDDKDRIRRSFADTRELFHRLAGELDHEQIDTLSMGMSDDFEIAVEEGSTMVRVGSALFGARS
ncbi:MAG: YggS family pyridoxal phosphate-dependent enzyme [Spirochaetales bacterium]